MNNPQKIGTKIRGRTAGDNWTIRRQVPRVPIGQSLVEIWMTVKLNLEDLDAAAIFQKNVADAVNHSGIGQIEDNGSSGTGIIRFDLMPADTVLLKPWKIYYYDIQVLTSTGILDTPDDGTIIATPQVTRDE